MKPVRDSGLVLLSLFLIVGNSFAQSAAGKLVDCFVPAPSLTQSLFETPALQPATIYLPPSYNDSTRRFPTIYFLPGFNCPIHYFTVWRVFQGFSLQASMDSLIQQSFIKEMIVVVPNGLNFMGGSFYANSPVTGNWEDFVVADLPTYIDSHHRTIASSESRGIAGYSMGGSGALRIAMKHPAMFSAVYALSPGIFAPGGLAKTEMFANPTTIEHYLSRKSEIGAKPDCDGRVHFMAVIDNFYKANQESEAFAYAYGAAFAWDSTLIPPFIAYPYEIRDGKAAIDSAIWTRYEEGFGDWSQKVRTYAENLRRLNVLCIDYGTGDEYTWIPEGCKYLSSVLDSAQIAHELMMFEGGHGDRVRDRIEQIMLPFFAKHLSGE